MNRPARPRCGAMALLLAVLSTVGGCTSLDQWVRNGFKVGPNFEEPSAKVADDWSVRTTGSGSLTPASMTDDAWWSTFNDPELDSLIDTARKQNLDLRTAAARVLQSQAQRNITAGNLLPQSQNAIGNYAHVQIGRNMNLLGNPMVGLPNTLNVWTTGFNASWELDFWGRLRRAVESANADLAGAVEGYRDAMVTLLADVATSYVQIRMFQQRLAFAQQNVEIQQGTLRIVEARLNQGRATSLDVEQARLSLAQTEASIPPLVIGMRQAADRLCVLLGEPAGASGKWGVGSGEWRVKSEGDSPLAPHHSPLTIPSAPPSVAVGIPAELLQRRPDVRRALREVAAQTAQIGVAQADFYPRFGVSGLIGYTADDIRLLLEAKSFTAYIMPSFQWKILNYGRIINNVRLQDARLEEKVCQYQQKVLAAGREVEDALVGFVQSQMQARSLAESTEAAQHSVALVLAQYKEGRVDFNSVFTMQSQLVTQQDQMATAQGNIALNLIAVYRALGGGWQASEQAHRAAPACLLPPVPIE